MTNAIQPLEVPEFSVEYTPTKIEIHDYENLERAVQAYSHRYSDIVVTDDTESEAKDIRAKLNKLSNALDDRRKEIKKQYNEPYDAFANDIKALQATLAESINPLDTALKELTVHQRERRQKHVEELIIEMAPNYEVSPDDIEIDSKWLNKSTSKKAVTEGVAAAMKLIKAKRDKLDTDILTIEKYAKVQKVEPAGWVDQLKQGQDVEYLMKAIDNEVEQQTARKREQEAKAAEEALHQESKGNAIVDTNTGEVVSKSVTLKIVATIPQMNLLKSFMDSNGIKYMRVGA
ncbi:DUF1351 domain-containing protein [Loigolactobacillus bifermentans]|nr:DUF1351 domain-containing protein [Loigolactobacillus bifermentans]QGG59672.1 DUF1351 domain-containing protein [Loigolactobacillus bifermentans]